MLKSLEISGFKSFAKKTSLDFKSKITAIVGPNGSGKSNVAEAFRFVLGEQSIKSMRGKKGEDLIWNGSQEIGRSNRAEVKLVFENSKNIFELDFEEVLLERIVNRDGSNEYYINKSQVRLKDIIETLFKANIGASGHHIISQGEADRILSASIKERKEMIEESLGLKIYQYKKEESQKKLLKTEENIKQVESLRREIAPHIKFLKKQVEKVEKAEELKKNLSSMYRQYLKRELLYINEQRKIIDLEKIPLIYKIKELDSEMEKTKKILEESKQKDEKSEKLLEIENKIENERKNKDKLLREIGSIEGEINANKKNIERLEKEEVTEENKTIPLKDFEELEKEIILYSEIKKILERIKEFISNYKYKSDNKTKNILIKENELLTKNKSEFEIEVEKNDALLFELSVEYRKIKDSIEKEKDSGRQAEKDIFKVAGEQSEIRNKLSILDMETKRINMIEEDWKMQIKEGGVLLGISILGFENDVLDNESHFLKISREEFHRELEKMKIRLEEIGSVGGGDILKEYKETLERDEFLNKELEDLRKSADSLEILIKDLSDKLDVEFKDGIEKINKIFQEFFSLMFDGGSAHLNIVKEPKKRTKISELEDDSLLTNPEVFGGEIEEEKLNEGLDISVSLPRKKIKSLEMLSGGERALTSIALLFAISQVNPPPFIILDETDAALDEANSKKYGDMIESLSKVSQLILITHNRETMSRAGVIYGVTMDRSGISRLLSIAFDEALTVAK